MLPGTVQNLESRGHKAATIRRGLVAIFQLRQEASLGDPTNTKAMRNIFRRTVREIGAYQEGKAPMLVPTVWQVRDDIGTLK